MKQVLQHLQNGLLEVADLPCPKRSQGSLLIQTSKSLISVGSERMLVEFSKANLLSKARQQPEKVRQVLDKIKTDGLAPTLAAVQSKLDQPMPLGYSNAGVVIDVGDDVPEFKVGDRVISNGSHAEIVSVPKNLCAGIPDSVRDEEAVFTVIASIGLQGIRLAQPTLGERFVVTGLGLIGQLVVQLLRAHGCHVLGLDFAEDRLALARRFGAETVALSKGEDPVAAAMDFSKNRGVDGVIITAATKSNEPMHQAAEMCRKRGRIVLVGVVGLELARSDFYEKELTFQVSCSYGPGRYDPLYEDKGQDYPLGFVRWTEKRNFEAILEMISDKRLEIEPLISHRFGLTEAVKAYEQVGSNGASSMGIVLEYPEAPSPEQLRDQTVSLLASETSSSKAESVVLGVVGAGSFASTVLLPAVTKVGVSLEAIATRGGASGRHYGKKFGFKTCTTDTDSLFANSAINTIVVLTRHDSHADLVCKALEAGKHVFVEKPLAITAEQLKTVCSAYASAQSKSSAPKLMVGFNRRFAPQVVRLKELLETVREAKTFIMTVNAGLIPMDHWTQDRELGGGRIVGEGCHFIDLLRFLAGAKIVDIQATMMGGSSDAFLREDKATITLRFEDGSIGTVHYFANGHKSFPKERP